MSSNVSCNILVSSLFRCSSAGDGHSPDYHCITKISDTSSSQWFFQWYIAFVTSSGMGKKEVLFPEYILWGATWITKEMPTAISWTDSVTFYLVFSQTLSIFHRLRHIMINETHCEGVRRDDEIWWITFLHYSITCYWNNLLQINGKWFSFTNLWEFI